MSLEGTLETIALPDVLACCPSPLKRASCGSKVAKVVEAFGWMLAASQVTTSAGKKALSTLYSPSSA